MRNCEQGGREKVTARLGEFPRLIFIGRFMLFVRLPWASSEAFPHVAQGSWSGPSQMAPVSLG